MKEQHKNTSSIFRIVLIVGLCGLVVLCACAGVFLLYHYTSSQMYQESVYQLEEISRQLFEKLDVQIDIQWGYLEKLASELEQTETITRQDLGEKIKHCEKDLAPVGSQVYFRAITDNGYYYTNEGRQGIWTAVDRLTGAERQSLLISNWLENETYMAFVITMTEDVMVDGHRIEYLVVLRTMADMQPYFHSSSFSGRNVAYIIDYNGYVLSVDGSLEGVDFDGKNVYHGMDEQTYPHMESFSAVMEQGKSEGSVCTDVIINGQSYYLIYNHMPSYDWATLLLVSASDVAVNASDMVSSLLNIFIIVILVLVLLMAVVFLFLSRIQRNKKLLATEEEARERLEAAQKKTEEALEVAENATKAKSQFLANMSHDIRTPMNAIMGVTSLMEHEVDNPEALRYYVQKLRQSGSYMLGLINDVLDMSKIESGDVQLHLESVKMAEQVGQIESIIRSQCNEKGQEFTVSVHEISHEYVIGDSIRLRQVFLNLLTNAVKYTPSGGSIHFEIEERPCEVPDHATFFTSVIDNGHGMKADFLKHIFEPFTREVSSVTNKIQGTGLGMSITKSLVDLMGGTIAVESEPEKGSRFDVTLTLPIDKTVKYAVDAHTVLMISDEQLLVDNVKAALKESSIELLVAPSLDGAVSLLCQKPVDAILLSGCTDVDKLTNTVKKLHQATKNAVLIFCFEYAHQEHVHKNLSGCGIDGLIARPFFFENLAIAIHSARGAELETGHDSQHSPLNGKRFLCAEDNTLNAEILEALLSLHNASCTICPDGLEIVKAFESVKPGDYDAILMDVQMPNMNGLQATRAIREGENPLGKTIPIIAMTANAFSSDVEECYNAGMDAHLAKPLDMTAMERTIRVLLSGNDTGGGALIEDMEDDACIKLDNTGGSV